MNLTLDQVLGCESCLLVANSATASKMQEIQGVSNNELLTHIAAIHFQQNHEERESKIRQLLGAA